MDKQVSAVHSRVSDIVYEPGTTYLFPYFGLAKCTVLLPQDLYHPVLP